VLDLGSGAGMPGLVMAGCPPLAAVLDELVLLEGSARRAGWLRKATHELQLDTVRVIELRAEVAGRRAEDRFAYSAVVTRSFGRPAVTAECAAPLLRQGGLLLASQPPATRGPVELAAESPGHPGLVEERWPHERLSQLGLSAASSRSARGFEYVVMTAVNNCDERFPRRNGVPAKRPLW
jgi:16S rRNA (guanine527-N7)-methyltransferase